MKPSVGDKLFSLNIGNDARYQKQELSPVTVTKVGRKYFYVVKDGYAIESKIGLDTWREATEYCANCRIYITRQEWEDEAESDKLCTAIYRMFNYGKNTNKVPLPTLRKVFDLIAANNPPQGEKEG